MNSISLASKVELQKGKHLNEGVLTVEPFYPGYAVTVGNALRRVLLSSLPGAAVTAVKITGADHEFSTLPGVLEDVVDIVLNLKNLRLKVYADTTTEPLRLELRVKGEKEVTAKDIVKNSDVEISNLDLHIATLTDKNATFEMVLLVEKGRGSSMIEERTVKNKEIGMIAVDALFSPVKNVGINVENVRVGDKTNYERLVLAIETDGTISAAESVVQAKNILVEQYSVFNSLDAEAAADTKAKEEDEEGEESPKKKKTTKKAKK